MRQRYVLVASGAIDAVIGIAFVFAPGLILGLFGGMSMERLTDQLFGAALIALAVVNWFARNAVSGDARRGVLLGNLVFNLVGLVALLLAQLTMTVNAVGWVTIALAVVFTIAFGYLVLAGDRETEPAIETVA